MDQGTHILLDMFECENGRAIKDHSNFISELENEIRYNGMTPVKYEFYYFGDYKNSPYTLFIILKESHISFHNDDRDNSVSCDIYTCNYSKDNTKGTEEIAKYIVNIFKPKNHNCILMKRGIRIEH